jgi:hypothetical protein
VSVLRDEFLSEEDLDLRTLPRDELFAYWDQWLLQAQATNDRDARAYSHGVFMLMEEPATERPVGDTRHLPCLP